jgi:hypothetical protein
MSSIMPPTWKILGGIKGEMVAQAQALRQYLAAVARGFWILMSRHKEVGGLMKIKKAMLVGLLYTALAVLIGFVTGCGVTYVGALPRLPALRLCAVAYRSCSLPIREKRRSPDFIDNEIQDGIPVPSAL